jgi:histidinol-phosphate aminotransferase
MSMPSPLPNAHLLAIARDQERHLSREGYLRLDRNERVSALPEKHFRAMVAQLSVDVLMAYPDAGAFVDRVAASTGLPVDHVVPTAGSDGGIRRIFTAFVSPGDVVQIANPTYAMYDVYSRIFQARARKIDYPPNLQLDVEAFVNAIDSRTRMVALADPDQPSGSTVTASDLRRIVSKCAEVGAVCVVDEAYYPFHAITVVPLIHEFDNLLVVRSFSKLPGTAGLRLGCALGAPKLVAGVDAVRGANEVAAISLLFGAYMLDHPEIADEFVALVEQGRKVLLDRVTPLGFEAPHCSANFQLLRCPHLVDATSLGEKLKRRHVLIKAGFSHPSVKNCIRVSVNGPEIMTAFCDVLDTTIHDLRQEQREYRAVSA